MIGGESAMRKWLHAAAAATCILASGSSFGQTFQMPPDSERCPSRWGPGDQRGSANWVKPETVLRASRLIKTGEIFELGAVLTSNPKESFINEGRQYNLYTKPSIARPNTRTENEEIVTTELGQIGTQVDAFAHQMWNDSFYNCFKQADIATRTGFRKLGVENFGVLMSRGVLIDVAGAKGVDMLPPGYVITPEDLQQALTKQNLRLQPGDAILINTGFGKLLGKDNAKYGKDSPGIGVAAGRWLVTQDPMLIGADNCCVEVRPSEPGMSLPIHSLMLIQHGIILLENLMLEKLAAAGAQETAFIMQPLKMQGATGSNVAPVAIR
jgi:kynurenine formamidase